MILGIIFVLLVGCIFGVYNKNMASKQPSPQSSPNKEFIDIKANNEDQPIYVHISGAVALQGLYKMRKNDRLIDLIRLSGVKSFADLDSLNLGEALFDGQRIIIQGKTVTLDNNGQPSIAEKSSGHAVNKININRADEKELDSLPGIGQTMAKRIVELRKQKGNFFSVDSLKEIEGMTAKKFEKIKGLITVN